MAISNEDTKKIITSLLTSTPYQCNIKILCRDFKDMVGQDIPFQKFGFSNVEQYLNSIPDTVEVLGRGPNAEVRLIVTEKSKHIHELVEKQKSSTKIRRPRRRTKRDRREEHQSRSYSQQHPRPQQVTPPSKEQISSCLGPIRPPIQFSSSDDELPKDTIKSTKSLASERSYPETSISHSGRNFPSQLLNNLQKLINKNPNGITCGDFMAEYEKEYKESIPFRNYCFLYLFEMCYELPNIFKVVKISDNEHLLYDSKKTEINNETTKKSPTLNNLNKTEDLEEDCSELTTFKFDWGSAPTFIPPDVLHLNDVIPRHFISEDVREENGQLLDIVVGEIYDPSKFYVYERNGGLKELMQKIQLFYNVKQNRFKIQEILQDEGLYCAVPFSGAYHRAIIINELPNIPDEVRVLFIDYGTVGNIPSSEIYYLNKAFGQLPSQAMRCRLSNICPPIENSPWSIEAKNRFRELIKGRDICAEIVSINRKEKTLEVYLADITDENNIFYLNDVLVDEGHALLTNQVTEIKI